LKKLLLKYLFSLLLVIGCLIYCDKSLAQSVVFTGLVGNATTLTEGSTNQVVFGFSIFVPASGTFNPIVLHISTSSSLNGFVTGQLKRTTTNNPALAPTGTTTGSINVTSTTLDISSFPSLTGAAGTGTTYYYYLVLSITVSSNTPPSSIIFSLPTSAASLEQNTYAGGTTINNLATPTVYTIPMNIYWKGGAGATAATKTDWGNTANWAKDAIGNGIGRVPISTDNVSIGDGLSYLFSPTLSAATTVTEITFGSTVTNNTLTVNSTLTVSGNINQNNSNTLTIAGTGTLAVNGALTLSSATTLTNSGTIDLTGSTTASTTSTLTNTGTFKSGSGTLTTGPLNNSGTFTAGSGNVTVAAAITTLTGGTFTAGSGTLTLGNGFDVYNNSVFQAGSGDITDANFLRVNAGSSIVNFGTGTTTLSQAVQMFGGTINCGTGPVSIASALQINSTATFNGCVAPGVLTASGTFSNSGTFNPGTGTVNFKNAYTNSSTFMYSAGTIVFNSAAAQSLIDNSTTGSLFNNVTFMGGGTKTMSTTGSGKFSVSSTGILTMGTSTTLATGNLLTLNSDATGSANVAAITSPSAITGNVNVQRYITGNSSLTYRGYRLLSSPVQVGATGNYNLTYLKGSGSYLTGAGGTTGGFDAGSNPTIYLYRQDMVPTTVFNAGNYRAVTAISPALTTVDGPASMPVGNGFLYFYRGNNGTVATTVPGNLTFSSTGALNQGKITVNLWFYSAGNPSFAGPNNLSYSTTSGTATVEGFNLVGNPYASSIDWHTAYNGTATTGIYAFNIDQTIYIYDATTKNYDTYLNTSSSAGSGTNGLTNVIPNGQGFFVHAQNGNAQLIFNESAKVNTQVTNGAGLLLNAKLPSAVVDQHLRLQLAKDSINKDETILIFNNAASTDYVQSEDALYLTGAGILNLSNTSTNNKALAISQIPFPKQSQTQTIIPLNVSAANTGAYKFSLTEALNIPALFDVWLMDAYTRDSLDMKHNPVYNFNVSADTATAGAKRFTLVIRQNKAYAYHLLSFNGVKATGGAQLSWTTENESDYTDFTLERSTGSSNTFTALNTITATGAGSYGYLDTNPAGVNHYRLKQTDINGTVTYSNVVQLQYADLSNSPLISNISLYPNPARDVLNLTILNTANAAASYTITITSSNGNLIKTYTSQQTTWQNNISDLLPGAYIVQVINNAYKTVVGESKFIKM
jgi:hypothetical protein